ncbi:site-specific DNA-methyltransferase [Streptomycetaceae bacterium NBC_01309]
MPDPYWTSDDGNVVLYLGDYRDVLPGLGLQPDLIVVDPPYGETDLAWDRWPDGWPGFVAEHTTARSMWCFGSLGMFLDHITEIRAAGWKRSQDIVGREDDGTPVISDVNVVWEKHNGSGNATDRFRRVHEHAVLFYRGPWAETHHDTPLTEATPAQIKRNGSAVRTTQPQHTGTYGPARRWTETGTRLMRSVIQVPSMKGRAIHETEKPVQLIDPLIRYSCPPDGLVFDPMAGSGAVLDAARQAGRRSVGIERQERYAEAAATRLASQLALEFT